MPCFLPLTSFNAQGFDELVDTLEARALKGILDASLLIENVQAFVTEHITPQKMAELRDKGGMHGKIFVVKATSFGCGTMRERMVLVAFRNPAHLTAFGRGPQPTSAIGKPLSLFIQPEYNHYLSNTSLFFENRELMYAAAHKGQKCQVVGPATTEYAETLVRM